MKTNSVKTKQTKGFTLIEMIGVLAVIAILAALLIPKVFQAITEARINTVPVGASTCKTAVVDHYAKRGGLNLDAAGIALAAGIYVNYDERVLMTAGFLDKPFAPRVGATADIILDEILAAETGAAVALDEGRTYSLAGASGIIDDGTNDVAGSHVVYALIEDVPVADAQAISTRIDGATMSVTEANISTDDDALGRVKYANGAATTDVYIYLTHR